MEKISKFTETKLKSIIVDGELHNKFKLLCMGKSMKIGAVTEDLIRLYLHNPKKIHLMIEESTDNTSH